MTDNYRVLYDYGIEGMKFAEGSCPTVDAAVQYALDLNYWRKFLIVKVIDWEAKEK